MFNIIKSIRQSLNLKLILMLLLVSLIGLLIVALLSRTFTIDAFERYVLEERTQAFKTEIIEHYQTNGSWEGLLSALPPPPLPRPPPLLSQSQESLNESLSTGASVVPNDFPRPPDRPRPSDSPRPPDGPRLSDVPRPADRPRPPPPPPALFAVADSNGAIVLPAPPRFELNQIVTRTELSKGVPLNLDGERIGTIIQNDNSLESNQQIVAFRKSLNRSLLFSAFGAFLLALGIGIVFTQTLTRPIRNMIQATKALARGEHQQLPVRSQDELGELSATFNQMSSDLEHSAQLRKQMTADIAHELRTPLTSLAWYLEAFQSGAIDANEEEFGIMHGQITHLQHLVDDLRTLSLADAGELKLVKEPTQAKSLLTELYQSYNGRAEDAGIELEVQATDNLADLNIDRARITQVLSNLVSNAFRYTGSGGKITLDAQQNADSVDITIKDTGSGISPEKLPHIFERFYRADEARAANTSDTDNTKESGLGLAIAKAIVEAHGGTIAAQSSLGKGTSLNISLPI